MLRRRTCRLQRHGDTGDLPCRQLQVSAAALWGDMRRLPEAAYEPGHQAGPHPKRALPLRFSTRCFTCLFGPFESNGPQNGINLHEKPNDATAAPYNHVGGRRSGGHV